MSKSLARKVLRQRASKAKKDLGKKLKKQISLFKQLPTACSLCGALFDKMSRADHMTWRVNVYAEDRFVGLTCPVCLEEEENGER